MNNDFANALAARNAGAPAPGWCLHARRAMSLRAKVPSRLHVTQGRAWVTLGLPLQGAGNESGDVMLASGDSLSVPAGALLVMEPWQPAGAGPVRFDWCAEPQARPACRPDRFANEVAAPARELARALGHAGLALGRLMRGLLGYSEYLVAGRGRVLAPFESNPP